MFGHPTRADEHRLLRFDPNHDIFAASDVDADGPQWQLVSGWTVRRDELSFLDYTTAREFVANLEQYPTLGGRWHTPQRHGGWWCLPASEQSISATDPQHEMPPLIPRLMATPWYPRRAIREAKEGTVVACFTVGADGLIRDAALIELSDEIFRNPTLSALQRSRYAPWNDPIQARPGCRSFSFELETVAR